MSFSPDTKREPTFFRGNLGKKVEFREAISALHSVVVSDLRWKPKDRTEYLAWLATQEDLDWEAIAGQKKSTAEELKQVTTELTELRQRSSKRMAGFYKARQRYFDYLYKKDYDAWYVLDPVITVHPDEIFFECFSQDESSYGRLAASYDVFDDIGEFACGTTNIDYSQSLYDEFQKIRSYKNTALEVDPSGFEVQTSHEESYKEVKIDLPDSWVRGFLQVSSAMSLDTTVFDLHPMDVHNMCHVLRRNRELEGPRGMRYHLRPDHPIRVVFEPWNIEVVCGRSIYRGPEPQEIRVWGRRRIHILERLIPAAKKFTVYLLGTGMPSFYLADLGDLTFTLGLSGWTANDWSSSGNFDLMAPRTDVDDLTKRRVFDALKENWLETPDALAKRLELDRGVVLGALGAYTQAGRAIYDLDKGVYRVRELAAEPLPMSKLRFSNEREEAAMDMLSASAVKVVVKQRDGHTLLSGIIGYRNKTFGPTLVLDGDDRMIEAECSCNFYSQNKLFKGPCEHMLATRIAHSRKISRFAAPAAPTGTGSDEPAVLRSVPSPTDSDDGVTQPRPGFFRRLANRFSNKSTEAASTQLVNLAIDRAVRRLQDEGLLELVRGGRAPLLESMLEKTFRARGMDDAIGRVFDVLTESDHVEELYGQDEQILQIIREAFNAVQPAAEEDD